MQNDKTKISFRGSYESVGLINEKHFSPREIDIIACISSGKSTKAMALLLSIAPKTVETHIRNIMGKLGCNSQDSIIVFVERSDKYRAIRNHYDSLLMRLSPGRKLEEALLDDNTSRSHPYSSEKVSATPMPEHAQARDIDELRVWGLMKALKKKRIASGFGVGIVCLSLLSFYLLYPQKNQYYQLSQDNKERGILSARAGFSVLSDTILLKRPKLLSMLDATFKKKGIQTVALIGMGGSGKTTLARHYMQQQQANVKGVINAESEERLFSSFEALAYELAERDEEKNLLKELKEIKDPSDRSNKLIAFVKEKLKSCARWILLFDNVEKFNDIRKYLPYGEPWGTGKILITTRDANIQNQGYIHSALQVGALKPAEKLELFIRILNKNIATPLTLAQKKQAKLFLRNIPPFPLDVSIAAFYLRSTGTSYEKYLENMQNYNKEFDATLEKMLKEYGEYGKTRYALVTLSLRNLIKDNPDFIEFLLLMSLLDFKNIPRCLLSALKNDVIFDSFIIHLKKYSLLNGSFSTPTYPMASLSLHRCTQEISLAYLGQRLSLAKNTQRTQKIVHTLEGYIASILDREDFTGMQLMLSHCEAFLTHKNFITQSSIYDMKGLLGCLYYCLGFYKKAQALLTEAYEYYMRMPGKNLSQTTRILAYLGEVHRKLGNYETAKHILEKSISISTQHSSMPHPDVAWAMVSLGNVYRELGNYNKAKEHLEQALIYYKKHFPRNHLRIAWASVYLGKAHHELGHYRQARELLEQGLGILKRFLPQNHIRIAWASASLGDIYREFGNYEKAKSLLEESLVLYKKHFSENNIIFAWVLASLGNTHRENGNYGQAKTYLEKSLIIYKKHFPEDHPDIAWALVNLGKNHINLGNYKAAKKCFEKSLLTVERNYGEYHIITAGVMKELSEISIIEGDFIVAENYLNSSLKIFLQNSRSKSYQYLESLAELYLKKAILEKNKGHRLEYENSQKQAVNYLKQALEILKTHFSEAFPHVARIQSKLALIIMDSRGSKALEREPS